MTDYFRYGASQVKSDPVALLVDGENLSCDFAEAVLLIAREYGVPTVRRVYGKAAQTAGWSEQGFRLVPTRSGKNAADLLLSVEAVSLALRERFHTLLIASSDSDYAYLAEHLRELGHEVIGIGEVQASAGYRATCTAFVELVRATVPKGPEPISLEKTTPQAEIAQVQSVLSKAKAKTDLEALVYAEIKAIAPKESILLADLNALMWRNHKTKIGDTSEGNWRKFLMARPNLFSCDAIGPAPRVSLK